jgi:hypothetical protein
MTPREVQGLQSLAMAHGGSLTVNPDTGLPEAGFLSSILPTLVGAGLSIASGGTLTPLMAAGIMGGGTALLTGNLQKGLMAGLGAYGGAGLGQGLMGMGAGSAGAAAQALGVPAATGAGSQAAMLAAQNAGFGQAGLEGLAQAAGGASPTGFEAIKAGISQAAKDPGAFVDTLGGGKKAMQYGLAAAAPVLAGQMVPTATQMPTGGPNPYQYSYDAGRVANPEEGYTGAATGERTYFQPTFTRLAKGGVADLARGGFVVPADVVSMLGEGSTDAGIRALRSQFGGAVKAIKGPGTGQSDSIATSIEGEQPARVADGEAYVPPEVVAKHGGAKKFYAMLDRVRAASQGHTKQQRRINPERVMA